MGILGFGGATKLEDLKVKDLKKERLTQEVKQDQLLIRIRHTQEQYDSMLEVASEPGHSDADVDVSAYKMSQLSKSKDRAEQDLQEVLTKMSVLDSTLDVINMRKELEKKCIWRKINEIPEEEMELQIGSLALERKESEINLNKIIETFDVDRQTVHAQRSADFRRSKDAILARRQEKTS